MKFFKNKNELNKKLFNSNYSLIKIFPNNKTLISKFYNLSKLLKYNEWIIFFEILLFDKTNPKEKLNQLKEQSEDNNLKNIIKLYT